MFVRHVFPTQPVRAIYRSATHPNLVVVDKENGGKSDALNAGLNVARYRYVCGVDADTVFDREGAAQGHARVVEDPARIIGVTSQLTIARDPARVAGRPRAAARSTGGLLMAYQHLDYLRAFFNNRLAWSRLGFMLCSSGRSRSGAVTCSRRSAATRARSPARTSSSRSACTSSSFARAATTRSTASPTTSA